MNLVGKNDSAPSKQTTNNNLSDRLDSSGSDEGLGMSIPVTSPRKPTRFIRSKVHDTMSPPYSGVRALRLFDSPATPKTLLENSSAIMTPVLTTPLPNRNRTRTLFTMGSVKSTGMQLKFVCFYTNVFIFKTTIADKKSSSDVHPAANVNPFTPTGMFLTSKKRTRSKRSLDG